MLVRHRRGWNLAAAVGTTSRAMLAGMTGIAALWVLGGIGLFPDSGDRPPNPGSLDDVHVFALIVWGLVTTAAWLVARGPDWRRQKRKARSVAGPDTPELVVGLVALVVLSVLALAVSPYTVLFAVPALHVWMCMASWRVIFSRTRAIAVWSAGLIGPALALIAIGARSDTGLGTGWFALQLVQTRTIPPLLALIGGAAAGVAGLLLIAALGTVASPALPTLRARWVGLRDGRLTLVDVLPRTAQQVLRDLARQAMRLRVPSPGRSRRAGSVVRDSHPASGQELDASARARLRAEARAANRRRVNSR
jgi:hypothetical protein